MAAVRNRASCSTPAAVAALTVQLDANGQAEVEVPLNDALTTFQAIVAVADDSVGLFRHGQHQHPRTRTCRSSAACRRWCANDQFRAKSRCATPPRPMKGRVARRATLLELKPQCRGHPRG